jgi:hypothetical protein
LSFSFFSRPGLGDLLVRSCPKKAAFELTLDFRFPLDSFSGFLLLSSPEVNLLLLFISRRSKLRHRAPSYIITVYFPAKGSPGFEEEDVLFLSKERLFPDGDSTRELLGPRGGSPLGSPIIAGVKTLPPAGRLVLLAGGRLPNFPAFESERTESTLFDKERADVIEGLIMEKVEEEEEGEMNGGPELVRI